ncbi:MAG: hypothetical protein M9908_07895 [Phyllobacteriaceae bacterium]|nr:hypothetical protein [Phyllobacteriaceae bacterium]
MGVINDGSRSGEFIMMCAYTHMSSVPVHRRLHIACGAAAAFNATFAAGVVMERLVIRHLMHRPLETLLATFVSPSPCSNWQRTSSALRRGRSPRLPG